jgi:hypothetical protein
MKKLSLLLFVVLYSAFSFCQIYTFESKIDSYEDEGGSCTLYIKNKNILVHIYNVPNEEEKLLLNFNEDFYSCHISENHLDKVFIIQVKKVREKRTDRTTLENYEVDIYYLISIKLKE